MTKAADEIRSLAIKLLAAGCLRRSVLDHRRLLFQATRPKFGTYPRTTFSIELADAGSPILSPEEQFAARRDEILEKLIEQLKAESRIEARRK